MKRLTATFEVDVDFEIPAHLCAKITKEDIAEMCASAVGYGHAGLGVQTVVEGVAQWIDAESAEKPEAAFSKVFVGGFLDSSDIRIQIEDDGFDVLEEECKDD